MTKQTVRTMTDSVLAGRCAAFRSKQLELNTLAKSLNAELGVDGTAILVAHDGTHYSVTGRYTDTDYPMFAEIVIPETGE